MPELLWLPTQSRVWYQQRHVLSDHSEVFPSWQSSPIPDPGRILMVPRSYQFYLRKLLSFLFLLLSSLYLGDGWPIGLILHQRQYLTLMDNPWWENRRRTSLLIFVIVFSDNLFLNLENVEWSGDGISKGNPRNFLKDILSLIWVSTSGSEGIRNHFCSNRHFRRSNGEYASAPSLLLPIL